MAIIYSILVVIMNVHRIAAFTNACSRGSLHYLTTGTVASPNYPYHYGGNMQCSWPIQVPRQFNITLYFDSFSTESGYDYVSIYDGSSTSAPQLSRYSGSVVPPDIISTSSDLYIEFSSDDNITSSGFRFHWYANMCNSTTCDNGGTCSDSFAGTNCSCVPGFTGDFCQTDIDECDSYPCMNGGTCVDHINYFTCMCPYGQTGYTCETAVAGFTNVIGDTTIMAIVTIVLGAVLALAVVLILVLSIKYLLESRRLKNKKEQEETQHVDAQFAPAQ